MSQSDLIALNVALERTETLILKIVDKGLEAQKLQQEFLLQVFRAGFDAGSIAVQKPQARRGLRDLADDNDD